MEEQNCYSKSTVEQIHCTTVADIPNKTIFQPKISISILSETLVSLTVLLKLKTRILDCALIKL